MSLVSVASFEAGIHRYGEQLPSLEDADWRSWLQRTCEAAHRLNASYRPGPASIWRVTGLVGISSDPAHIVAYSDGEVRQEYEVTLSARAVGGAPAANEEASDVRWVLPEDMDELDIHPTMRGQIDVWLTGQGPHID